MNRHKLFDKCVFFFLGWKPVLYKALVVFDLLELSAKIINNIFYLAFIRLPTPNNFTCNLPICAIVRELLRAIDVNNSFWKAGPRIFADLARAWLRSARSLVSPKNSTGQSSFSQQSLWRLNITQSQCRIEKPYDCGVCNAEIF